jgi:hypothetical protein
MTSKQPVRLYKMDDGKNGKWCEYIEGWVLSHPLLCATALILILLALFVTVCFLVVGVSGTESGMMYNKFNNMI